MSYLKTLSIKKICKSAFLLVLVLIAHRSFSQPASWQWAKSTAGNDSNNTFAVVTNQANAVATDVAGNVYEVGAFQSAKLSFGTDTVFNTDTSSVTSDIYLVKYDAAGNVLWARSAGGTSNDGALSVATDRLDNVYVSGFFHSTTLSFGTDTLRDTGVYNDIFVAKYNASGNLLWVKGTTGGVGPNDNIAMAVDFSGNVFVTGSLSMTTFVFAGDTLTGSVSDILLLKYGTDGNEIWVRRGVGDEINTGSSVTTDPSGNVYIAGIFTAPVMTFDTIALHMIPDSADAYAIYLVKYDAAGNLLWAKADNNSVDIPSVFVVADSSGNVYLSGSYRLFSGSTLSFGTDAVLLNNNIFLAKYGAAGNVIWAKSYCPYSDVTASAITVDVLGNIYLSGHFGGTITFVSDTLWNAGNSSLGVPIFNDAVIFKFDSNGNGLWATSIGGSRDDNATGITTDISGNLYICGYFNSSTLAFGAHTITDNNAPDTTFESGPFFPFLAKYGNANTGIKHINTTQPDVTVYPNPVINNPLTVSIPSGLYSNIIIYNTCGIQVYNTDIIVTETTKQINLPGLSAGVYYLKAIGSDHCSTVPFVINH